MEGPSIVNVADRVFHGITGCGGDGPSTLSLREPCPGAGTSRIPPFPGSIKLRQLPIKVFFGQCSHAITSLISGSLGTRGGNRT